MSYAVNACLSRWLGRYIAHVGELAWDCSWQQVTTDVYGEYFLAELIEAQNKENQAIVAEVRATHRVPIEIVEQNGSVKRVDALCANI